MSRLAHILSTLSFIWRPRVTRHTVRYAFPLVAVMSALVGAVVLDSLPTSYVRITPSTTTVEAGEEFRIDVYAFAAEPANAINISLSFPPDQVTILGVDIGESVITLWTQDPYIEGNQVILSGGTYQKGFKGEHLIARVNVRAEQAGLANFTTDDVRLLAGDGAGTPLATDNRTQGAADLYIIDDDTDIATIQAELGFEIVTDIDGDGKVTLRDVSVFMSAWTSRSRIFDFNGDGKMSFRDFSIILADSFLK